jgi:hypothetical protein
MLLQDQLQRSRSESAVPDDASSNGAVFATGHTVSRQDVSTGMEETLLGYDGAFMDWGNNNDDFLNLFNLAMAGAETR